MSIFDGKRLTNETFKLDIERMRTGWYSDKYFENITAMLAACAESGYRYTGHFSKFARRGFVGRGCGQSASRDAVVHAAAEHDGRWWVWTRRWR